jgi:membrane protease YdiL (CAAX protease family)
MNNTFYTLGDPAATPDPLSLPPLGADPAEARRTFSRIGIAYAVLVLVLQVTAVAAQYLLYFLAPAVLSYWWINWVFSLVPLYGVALPVLWLILKGMPVSPHNSDYALNRTAALEKTPFHMGHWMILLVIAFGCMTAGGLLGNTTMSILSAIMDYDYANGLANMVDSSPVWVTVIGGCICGPLGEELLFRKLLIDRTRRYGDLPSILLSGILFGLFHGNLFQFFYATLVGMVFAYVYTRTGKYWWCFAMHAVVNLMGGVITPGLAGLLPEDLVSFTSPLQPFIYLFIVMWQYGMLIAGIVLFCVLLSKRKLSGGTDPLYRENAARLMVGNVGMILCFVMMALLMAVNLWPVR